MTTRRTRRGARSGATLGAIATAVAIAVGLSGCVPAFLPRDAPSTSTPSEENVAAPLREFYGQVLSWDDCGDGLQCTTASAPLDWDDPTAGTVDLALVRHPATGGDRIGSLLVNPGGPGASGYDFIKDSLDYATDDKLQSRFDIVGFDPRGVGQSSAVACLDAPAMDEYLYGIPAGERGSDAWIEELEQSAADFGAACAENSGPLLGEVDTVSAARDVDLLRAVLGDKKLNYLGYSYGTFLGATYAELYPERTGRLVLDGAVDPATSNFEVTKVQAQGFESALRAYLSDCLAASDCPFDQSVDDAMGTVRALLDSVDASPIASSDGRRLGSSALLTGIIYPLYDPNAWEYLSAMFAAVMHGDADPAFQLADAYNGRNPDGTYSDNSTEAFVAVNCLDYSYNAEPASMREQAAEIEEAAPVIGKYMSFGDIGCAHWPYTAAVERKEIHASGSAPILVVGTTNDPATPYVWAQNLAGQLENGHLLTYTGEGHTAYNKSNSCVNDTIDGFLIDGRLPESDPRC